jgi:hypothetical protein
LSDFGCPAERESSATLLVRFHQDGDPAALQLGGTLGIETAPGEGTVVSASIPLAAPP